MSWAAQVLTMSPPISGRNWKDLLFLAWDLQKEWLAWKGTFSLSHYFSPRMAWTGSIVFWRIVLDCTLISKVFSSAVKSINYYYGVGNCTLHTAVASRLLIKLGYRWLIRLIYEAHPCPEASYSTICGYIKPYIKLPEETLHLKGHVSMLIICQYVVRKLYLKSCLYRMWILVHVVSNFEINCQIFPRWPIKIQMALYYSSLLMDCFIFLMNVLPLHVLHPIN